MEFVQIEEISKSAQLASFLMHIFNTHLLGRETALGLNIRCQNKVQACGVCHLISKLRRKGMTEESHTEIKTGQHLDRTEF